MKHFRTVLTILISMVVGSIATLLFLSYQTSTLTEDWYDLIDGEVAFSTDALFSSDIRLPGVLEKNGRVKFLPTKGKSQSVKLGYKLSVTVDSLDKEKIPEKYRKTETIKAASGEEWKIQPLEEVVYEVTFEFALKDKDDFTLITVKTKPKSLTSGKTNQFQDITPQQIPIEIAKRAKAINFKISVDKCVSCK